LKNKSESDKIKKWNKEGGDNIRYHNLRFDIWLCLLLSVLLCMGAEKVATGLLEDKYKEHKEEHKVEKGQVGGVAGDDLIRAQNIEDLLSNEYFTIESPGIEYRNKGAGFHNGYYLYAITLPSKEKVAARINQESVVSNGDSIYSGTSTMPVGKIIKEDLTKDKTFLDQIEFKEPLDRKDFYIDMVGAAEIQSKESFIETPIIIMQIIIVLITFPIFHAIGSKLGIFPYFFAPKNKKTNEWD